MLRHKCRGQETTAKRQFLPLLCGFLSTLNPSFLQAHWWTFQNKYGVYASITMHAGESTCGINLVELLGSSDACLPRAGWCCYWILEANDAPGNQSKFDHVSEDMISEFFSILSILLKAPCFHSPLGWPKAATYSVKRGDGKRACVPSHTECHLAQYPQQGLSYPVTLYPLTLFPLNHEKNTFFLNKNVQPQCKGTLADQISRLAWASGFP